jgi:hypothetical protein
MKFEQGKVVKWENKSKAQIVFLITNKIGEGVVIHSDSLISVGTLVNLNDYDGLLPFVGAVHIKSEASN